MDSTTVKKVMKVQTPLVADSDEDGLTDGEEVNEHSSNPTEADTDGDGYLDGWEVAEGSDPADDDSVIYEGGWPLQSRQRRSRYR